jgi:hypothetical protein
MSRPLSGGCRGVVGARGVGAGGGGVDNLLSSTGRTA